MRCCGLKLMNVQWSLLVLYKLLRPLLFKLEPEYAHSLALKYLKHVMAPWMKRLPFKDQNQVNLWGLNFKNPVGLAAGFDKNADYIDVLFSLGFGFIEVGGVTPQPQAGNPKPRVFRIPQTQAIINRMGFNNLGVDHVVKQLKQRKSTGIIGVNIGKNKQTSLENSCADYEICLTKVYPVADYVSINISSPNTPGLRKLQLGGYLKELMSTLHKKRLFLQNRYAKKVPLLVKTSIDLSDHNLLELVDILLEYQIDGIIMSNTTLNHTAVASFKNGHEQGGLSGQPITKSSNKAIQLINKHAQNRLPIIGVGGIMTAHDAASKVKSGACLVQLYTGLIYTGTSLISECINAIRYAERMN